jgi:hypothetical protein
VEQRCPITPGLTPCAGLPRGAVAS